MSHPVNRSTDGEPRTKGRNFKNMADPNATEERPAPLIGISPSFLTTMDDLKINAEEFSMGTYSDIQGTIVGFEEIPGGQEKESKDGRKFKTNDQLALVIRIDNADELGLDDDGAFTRSYLPLPRKIVKDGVERRADPGANNDYGRWITALEQCGISARQDFATEHLMTSFSDLYGLRIRRQNFETEVDREGRKRMVGLPSEVHGWDNEVRAAAGLPPLKLRSESASAPAAANGRSRS